MGVKLKHKRKAEDIKTGSLEEATIVAEIVFALEKRKTKSVGVLRQSIYKRLNERGIDLTEIIQDYAQKHKRLTSAKVKATQQALEAYKTPQEIHHDYDPKALTYEPYRRATDRYKPKKGTVLHRLWEQGHLTERQCRAADMFIDIVSRANDGKIPGLTASHQPVVDTSGNRDSRYDLDKMRPTKVMSIAPNSYARREKEVMNYLHRHEALILLAVKRDYYFEQFGEKLDPRDIGKACTKYKNEGQLYAAGVSKLQSMLTSMAEYFTI